MRKNLACFKHFVLSLLFLILFSGAYLADTPMEAKPGDTHRGIHLSWMGYNDSDSSMTISWFEAFDNTTKQAKVKYGTQPNKYPYEEFSISEILTSINPTTKPYIHVAELYGLMPNTIYYYVVGSTNDWSEENSFTTGPDTNSDDKFSFVVGSDSHTTSIRPPAGDPPTRCNEMAYYIMKESPKPGFLFFGGDEISGHTSAGKISLTRQWNRFFSPNTSKGTRFQGAWAKMLKQFPYMTSDSNHVDSDDSFFDLFSYPYHFGYGRLATKPSPVSGCSYNIDYTGNKRGNAGWYSFTYGNAYFLVLQINTAQKSEYSRFCTWDVPSGGTQYKWLEDELMVADANPGIRWKFAIWHSAPYSFIPPPPPKVENAAPEFSETRGLQRNKKIQESVCVLLNKYNVDMVFSGHQHRYERSKMILNDETTVTKNKEGEGVPYIQSDYSIYDKTKDGIKKGVIYLVTAGMGNVNEKITPSDSEYTAVKEPVPHQFEPIHFKANHYLTVDIDNNTGTATCSVKGYKVLKKNQIINFKEAPQLLDQFRIVKQPGSLRVISDETFMGEGVTEIDISLNPPVVPSHAFIMVKASNSNNQTSDDCGVFQITGKIDPTGKKLTITRSGNPSPNSLTTPSAHISYQIIQSPDIKVTHGSATLEKFSTKKEVILDYVPFYNTITTLSSRSGIGRKFYHETQVMGNIDSYEYPQSKVILTRKSGDEAKVDIEWSAITFKDDVNIYKGYLELKDSSFHYQDVTLHTTIDPSKSWLYFTTSGVTPTTDNSASIKNHMVSGTIWDGNTLRFSRMGLNATKYPAIQWFVIEFPEKSNAFVQRGTLQPGKLEKTAETPITSQTNSFISQSIRGDGSWYDFSRIAWINRFKYSGSSIEFERWTDGQPGVIDWQVVKFPE